MTGPLILTAIPPTAALEAVTKQYVDQLSTKETANLNSKINKIGDAMTGFLSLVADPLVNLEAATKHYVDLRAGNVASPPPFPAGTVVPFWQAAAPVGWTLVTTHSDKALRVVSSGGGGAGGTYPFSTVYAQTVVGNDSPTTNYMPFHGHTGPSANWQIVTPGSVAICGQGVFTASDWAGGGWAHNHSVLMAIQYIDVIIASKN
jgi:hypothetical protein